MNKAIILGNLTRDPELKTLPSGIKVTSFALATNRVWKDEQGQKKEAVEFHNIVVFGRQAETSAQYLAKGSKCVVEGRLQTQSWEDTGTGKKMYRTEIVAQSVTFLSSPNQDSAKSTPSEQVSESDGVEYPEEDIDPSEIPF